MKLKEGMYVRTKDGEIKKIFQYNEQENNPMWCTLNCYATFKGIFSKASYNIIDLIEEDDFVDGVRVIKGEEFGNLGFRFIDADDNPYFANLNSNYMPKSIVTKEQFESISYKVGE